MARACAAAGIPYCLSTVAGISLEDLRRQVPDARLWYQLYIFHDDALNDGLAQRAQDAGYEALLVTTDTHLGPKRERDRRRGFTLTLARKRRNNEQDLARPRGVWDVLVRAGQPENGRADV